MVIADDSIMHNGDSPTMIKVGVCIDICFVTVSCPSCVTDCDVVIVFRSSMDSHALDAISTEAVGAGELGQNPRGLVLCIPGYRHNTARVVAS